MITYEQYFDWVEHPMTQLYLQKLTAEAHVLYSMKETAFNTMSIQQMGEVTLARANYALGIEWAADVMGVLGSELVENT